MERRNLGEHQVVHPVPMSFALSAVGIGDEAPSLMAVPAEHLGAHVEHEERPVKPGRAENTVGQGVQFAGFDQAGHDHRRYDGSWARQTGGDHKPRLGDDVAVVVALRDLAFLLDAQRIGRPGSAVLPNVSPRCSAGRSRVPDHRGGIRLDRALPRGPR